MCKKNLAKELKQYQNHHTKQWTKWTHYVSIPLIIFSLLTLTGWVHIRVPGFFDMPLSWLLSIILLGYYFCMDITLAAIVTGVFIVLNLIVSLTMKNHPSWLSLQVFLVTFILGWVLQLIGHFIKKEKPAFLSELNQLFIAPLFFAAELLFCFGKKQDLKKAMEIES